MKRFWFKQVLLTFLFIALIAILMSVPTGTFVLAQQPTETPGAFVTVTYAEQINVRSGPNTVLYDIIGHMQPGDTAPALGVSPGHDWVLISFPSGPNGLGWVHVSLISVTGGPLQIIEPPPTATPRVTATIDPTLAAAFNFAPTPTRLPTFTPPPPLPTFALTDAPAPAKRAGAPIGIIILGLGIAGVLGYFASYLRRS